MPSCDQATMNGDHPTDNAQAHEPVSISDSNALHPHGLYIASLLLSAYDEFLEIRRARHLDAPRNPSYNRDKNICTGGKNGELG